jgi:hypothetical protein
MMDVDFVLFVEVQQKLGEYGKLEAAPVGPNAILTAHGQLYIFGTLTCPHQRLHHSRN